MSFKFLTISPIKPQSSALPIVFLYEAPMNKITIPSKYLDRVFSEPKQWGDRGDSLLWNCLKSKFTDTPRELTGEQLLREIHEDLMEFGIDLSGRLVKVLIKAFDKGDGDCVDTQWWIRIGLPLIEQRLIDLGKVLAFRKMKLAKNVDELFFIGDIHAQYEKLTDLLENNRYVESQSENAFTSGRLVFLGDLIDNKVELGGDHLLLLNYIKDLVDNKLAYCVLGNHEFNAIGWSLRKADGSYCRDRKKAENRKQHQLFLDQVDEDSRQYHQWIEWFKTLPLFLDFADVRVIHACWHQQSIDEIRPYLNDDNSLKTQYWYAAFDPEHALYQLCETLLKGPEMALPEGYSFKDKNQIERKDIRVGWWKAQQDIKTFRDLAVMPNAEGDFIPDLPADPMHTSFNREQPVPVVVGHYTLNSSIPYCVGDKVICVDFNAASSGKALIGYKMDLNTWKSADELVSDDNFRGFDLLNTHYDKALQAEFISKAKGSLLGLALGDALGTTLEFKAKDSYQPLTDMVGGGPFHLKAGQWTDDTSMALCLADSLLAMGRHNAEDQMQRYIRWRDLGENSATGKCFDIGNTVSGAISEYLETKDANAGSEEAYTAGNGSLMRFAPVAIFYSPFKKVALAELIDKARLSSIVTHAEPRAIESCQIMAWMLYHIFAGEQCKDALFTGLSVAFTDISEDMEKVVLGSFLQKSRAQIRGTGFVVDSLEAALWCFANSESFEEGALLAANLGDDADTTTAIFGQLAGAFYGIEQLPKHWLCKLAWREKLEQRAEFLALTPPLSQLTELITNIQDKTDNGQTSLHLSEQLFMDFYRFNLILDGSCLEFKRRDSCAVIQQFNYLECLRYLTALIKGKKFNPEGINNMEKRGGLDLWAQRLIELYAFSPHEEYGYDLALKMNDPMFDKEAVDALNEIIKFGKMKLRS